jgi:hypothetical protein
MPQAQPDRLDARFAVALASEESAHARNLTQYLVQPRLVWREFVVQQVGGLNFVRIEEQIGIEGGAGSAHGDILSESVGLKYSKIKWKYTQQKIGGGGGGNTAGGWDLAANKVA